MAKNDAIAKVIAADPHLKERRAPTAVDQQLLLLISVGVRQDAVLHPAQYFFQMFSPCRSIHTTVQYPILGRTNSINAPLSLSKSVYWIA